METSRKFLLGRWKRSSISNACVIRVTNQCDQKCDHCAFRSSPENVGHMSVEMCKRINNWLPLSVVMNIMGGEFTILKEYPLILLALAEGRDRVRMVTNGFWARDKRKIRKFMSTMEQLKEVCPLVEVAVSGDKWHVKSGQPAVDILKDNDVGIELVKHSWEIELIPMGRAWDNNLPTHEGIASCKTMCNLFIREDGMICKCPYGYFPLQQFDETSWFNIQEQIWFWRAGGLVEEMICKSCMQASPIEDEGKTIKLPVLVEMETK